MRAVPGAPRDPQLRPVGSRRRRSDRGRRAGPAAGRAPRSRVVDFGEFDLAELRALIARSRLFVGGDTGPLHIAATTATPIVGIYGPTLPARSTPWRIRAVPTASLEVAGLPCRPCDQRVCAPGDFRCLTTLHARSRDRGGRTRAELRSTFAATRLRRTSRMITMPEQDRPAGLERAAWLALLAFAASLQFSIFAAGVLLTLTAVLWLTLVIRNRERIEVPRMFWPLAAYGAVDAASRRSLGRPRRVSLIDSKQLVLFAIVPIAYRLLPGRRSLTAVDVIITVGALSASTASSSTAILNFDNLGAAGPGHARALHDLLGRAHAGRLHRRGAHDVPRARIGPGRRWSCRRCSSRSR